MTNRIDLVPIYFVFPTQLQEPYQNKLTICQRRLFVAQITKTKIQNILDARVNLHMKRICEGPVTDIRDRVSQGYGTLATVTGQSRIFDINHGYQKYHGDRTSVTVTRSRPRIFNDHGYEMSVLFFHISAVRHLDRINSIHHGAASPCLLDVLF